jgi:hypothetical protein
LPPSSHVGAEQASSGCRCSDARRWQLEEGRNIEMTGCSRARAKKLLSTIDLASITWHHPSILHAVATALTPTTWHAGGQLSRRPIRWLAEEQSRLLNRRLCASAVGPDHLLASGHSV